ncbi:MAG: hypothetical protein WB987_00675 [Candidatus Acidiferrales bacterium]
MGRSAVILAALVLCITVARAQSNGTDNSNSQQPQQNQAASQEKSPQDKPADNKKDSKSSDPATTKLRIHVTAADKPVGNASVYVRFPVAGGLFHKDKLAELNLKTNEDGSAKVPDIPRGKILIQVVAKGWKTYGKWYEIDSDTLTVEIKLEPPPHWY